MFILMNKNKEVLRFNLENGFVKNVKVIDISIAPEMLKSGYTGALERWLSERSLDTTRFNARLLLKKMNISNSPFEIVVTNKALNLTDTFWIKDINDKDYSNISLQRKDFNKFIVDISLSGALHDVPKIINPELTNIGSYDKAWIKKDEIWYLVKKGDDKSLYSEMFAYIIGNALNLNMAKYFIKDKMVWSENFTNEDIILEHYASFRYKFESIKTDEQTIYNNLSKIGMGEEYINMLLLDAVINNIDRHEFNFGILKNANTGDIIKFSPYFDHNLAFGGVSKPSIMQLLTLIKDFDLKSKTKQWSEKINISLIENIDKDIREQVNPNNLNHEEVIKYFERIIKVLNEI